MAVGVERGEALANQVDVQFDMNDLLMAARFGQDVGIGSDDHAAA